MNMTSFSERHPHVAKMLLVLLGIVFALILAELITRSLPVRCVSVSQARKCIEYLPAVGVPTVEPHSTLIHVYPGGCNRVRYNAFGFRGPSLSLTRKPGEFRIAVMGDSYIEGREVTDDELATTQIERRMGSGVVLMNFGLAGSSQAEQLLIYRNRVREFKPDLVIVCVTLSNDFEDNVRELSQNKDKNFLEIKEGALVGIPPPSWIRFFCLPVINRVTQLVTNSALFRVCQRAWIQMPSRSLVTAHSRSPVTAPDPLPEAAPSSEAPPAAPQAPDPLAAFDSPAYDHAKEVMTLSLLSLRHLVERDGAGFLLMNGSDVCTFLARENPGFMEKSQCMERRYQWIARFAAQHNFAYLDLSKPLQERLQRGNLKAVDLHLYDDGHWTPLAHGLVAEIVSDYLNGPLGRPLMRR